jgi:hypothetical protein
MSREFSPQTAGDPRSDLSFSYGRFLPHESRSTDHTPIDDLSPMPGRRPERSQRESRQQVQFIRGRAMLYDGDHVHQLTETEVRTIVELGKFRVIATHDLAGHSYGSHEDAERDVRSLVDQGLAQKGTFEGPESTPRELLTLTRGGHRLLRASRLVPGDQAIHSGFVKPKDADHDADLYLLYQKEAHRIEKEGGRNLRVLLDYELKRRINRDIARFGVTARTEIAQRHGLRVVHNKIPIPDMRIEYETREGEIGRVNLELVTEHYGGRQAAEKMLAGFSLYTRHGEADRLRRVLDQHELTAEILSL